MGVRCGSSHLMSPLMAWRNRYGSEEHWPEPEARVLNFRQHVAKSLCAEVGVVLIGVAAVVETVALTVFRLVARVVDPVVRIRSGFLQKLLESSLFTCYWAFREALGPNLFVPDRPTHESFARQILGRFRVEDQEYIDRLSSLTTLDPQIEDYFRYLGMSLENLFVILNHRGIYDATDGEEPEERKDHIIRLLCPELRYYEEEGAMWIREHIFEKVTPETNEQLQSVAPEAFSFIITKSVFEYVFGSAREDPFPLYLTLETRQQIHMLRSECKRVEKSVVDEVDASLRSLDAYRVGPKAEETQKLFNKLRAIEPVELRRSFFLTNCLRTALRVTA